MKSKNEPPKHKRKSVPRKKIVEISSFEKTNSENSQTQLGWHIKDLFDLLHEYLESINFASLFTVKDAISIGLTCKTFHKIFNKEYIILVAKLGNLDPDLRYLFWIYQAPYSKYFYIDFYNF